MKKTLNITIGGRVFAIEEDAYEKLNNYLEAVKKTFVSYPDPEDIIADMEGRLAEQFQSMHDKNGMRVITLQYVESVIKVMGTPEDIEQETDKEESASSQDRVRPETKSEGSRRLYRNSDDKIIFGVCSGIAAYFNIDPIWIRIGFIVLSFTPLPIPFLPMIILYTILAVIIPEAKTTTEKMEMRGQPITIAGLKDTIRQEFTDEKNKERVEKLKNLASEAGDSVQKVFDEHGPRVESVFKRIIRFPFEVIIDILKFIKNKIFPIIIRIIGIFTLLSSVIGLFALTTAAMVATLNRNSPYVDFPVQDIATGSLYFFLIAFGYLIFLIPVILVGLLGLTMLRYKNSFPKTFTLSLVSAWIIIGVFGGAVTVSKLPEMIVRARQLPYFKQSDTTYPFKDFNKLTINGPYNVVVKQGKKYSVEVLTSEYSLSHFEIKQTGDTLVLSHTPSQKSCIIWCDNDSAYIIITMPDLQEISHQELISSNIETARNNIGLYPTITYITLEDMNLDSLKVNLLRQHLDLKNTSITNLEATSTYSFFRGEGRVKNLKLVSDSSEWWSDKITVNHVEANLKNHSRALFATQELIITASEWNKIYYTGHPKIVSHIDPGTILEPYDEYLKNQTGWQNSEETIDLNRLNSSEPSLDPNLSQE